jgi:hypothetical protein
MSTDVALSADLVARARITQLLDEFSGRVDRGESVADLMEENSRFVTHMWQAEGRDKVTEKLLSLADDRKEKGREARHVTATVTIENLGSGKFRVRSLMIVMMLDTKVCTGSTMNIGAHNDIVSISDGGICRFVERTVAPAMKFSMSPQ